MEDRDSGLIAGPQLDYDWVTDRLAVGGAIWTRRNMEVLGRDGITHVVDMQTEFDDSLIADGTGIQVLWNPCDDDFEEKPPHLFERGVQFAEAALGDPRGRVYFHCAAGVHRGPMMLLACLAAGGMQMLEAMELIRQARPQADFPDVYRRSVLRFLDTLRAATEKQPARRKPRFNFKSS